MQKNGKQVLRICLSWVDDILICGPKQGVEQTKNIFLKIFECDDVGPMMECVGCKADRTSDCINLTQPVILQSFEDEFELPNHVPITPAAPGQVLVKGPPEANLEPQKQTKYRSCVGKLLHVMRWSRPDVQNATRELSKFMTAGNEAHMKSMLGTMKCCVETKNLGLILKPTRRWNGVDKSFKFKVHGLSDAAFNTDPDNRTSVSGTSVFVENSLWQ